MLSPGVLQVVVEPSYCTVLEAFWNDHFAILTEYVNIINQLGCIALCV